MQKKKKKEIQKTLNLDACTAETELHSALMCSPIAAGHHSQKAHD